MDIFWHGNRPDFMIQIIFVTVDFPLSPKGEEHIWVGASETISTVFLLVEFSEWPTMIVYIGVGVGIGVETNELLLAVTHIKTDPDTDSDTDPECGARF